MEGVLTFSTCFSWLNKGSWTFRIVGFHDRKIFVFRTVSYRSLEIILTRRWLVLVVKYWLKERTYRWEQSRNPRFTFFFLQPTWIFFRFFFLLQSLLVHTLHHNKKPMLTFHSGGKGLENLVVLVTESCSYPKLITTLLYL